MNREVLYKKVESIYYQHGLSGAVSLCHKIILYNPLWGDTYSLLGDLLLAHGKEDEASRAYRQAILVSPHKNEFLIKLQEITTKSEQKFGGISIHWIGDTPIQYQIEL